MTLICMCMCTRTHACNVVCEHHCLSLWTSMSWFMNISVLICEHVSLSWFVNSSVSVCKHQCLGLWTSLSWFVIIIVFFCEHMLLSWFVNIIVLVCEHVSLSWFVNSIQGPFWLVLTLGFMYELWSHWLWLEPMHCHWQISRPVSYTHLTLPTKVNV